VSSRLAQYIRYHEESARIGDIDPAYGMLLYVCDRFELNVEQRYWLAWLYAMTYCGASAFYLYNEFPDFENVDAGRLQRWWDSRGRQCTVFQTDRRWVRSRSQFVDAFLSYRRWIGPWEQHRHFSSLVKRLETPEARYSAVYDSASRLYTMGQFTLFLYLEALHTLTPLDLCPTDLDLNRAWSCRYGLYYAYDRDEWVTDAEEPMRPDQHAETAAMWSDLRARLEALTSPPTVWQTETILCAFRKFHRGKRYIGYYLDRQAAEVAKMERQAREGVCWRVLWDYRREHLHEDYLAELGFRRYGWRELPALDHKRGEVSTWWKNQGRDRTVRLVEET